MLGQFFNCACSVNFKNQRCNHITRDVNAVPGCILAPCPQQDIPVGQRAGPVELTTCEQRGWREALSLSPKHLTHLQAALSALAILLRHELGLLGSYFAFQG